VIDVTFAPLSTILCIVSGSTALVKLMPLAGANDVSPLPVALNVLRFERALKSIFVMD
jgi:hypothetical protein